MALLTGFVAIVVVILCGVALAHTGILDAGSQRTLSEVSFFVAVPALMLLTISRVEVGSAMVANLTASAASLLVTAGVYALVAGLGGAETRVPSSSARSRRPTSTPATSASRSRPTSSATPPSSCRHSSCSCCSCSR